MSNKSYCILSQNMVYDSVIWKQNCLILWDYHIYSSC